MRTRTKKKGLKKKRGHAVGGPSAAANEFLSRPFLANVMLDEAMMRDDNDNENNGELLNKSSGTTESLQQLENL